MVTLRRIFVVSSILVALSGALFTACGGGTTTSPTTTPGIVSSITLAALTGVDPPSPSADEPLSLPYGGPVTVHFLAEIASADMNPNLAVMACLGLDEDTYIESACRGKGPGALSTRTVDGVTLPSIHATGTRYVARTYYVHVFVLKNGMMNSFSETLRTEERNNVPFNKLRDLGLLISVPSSTTKLVDWK